MKAYARLVLQLVLTGIFFTFHTSGNLMAEPIGLMEKYALAADRDAMLAELIPGSEDYFFLSLIHISEPTRPY